MFPSQPFLPPGVGGLVGQRAAEARGHDMWMKGALHVHSTCSDGELTIPQLVDVYRGLGFSFLALTDHDHLLRAGSYARHLAGLHTDLIVLTGVELTVFEKGYLHVGRIDGNGEQLHIFNHPAELGLPVEKVLARLESVAGSLPIDAVEVTSHGFYTPEFDIPEISYPKVATDDAHSEAACGRAWVELDCAPTKEAILRAIRRGEFRNGFAARTVSGA
jgi:hypothetical protein